MTSPFGPMVDPGTVSRLAAKNKDVLDCGHEPTPTSLGTGYATTPNGLKVCYECAAEMERDDMFRTGKAVLYLTQKPDGTGDVTNWTGHLGWRTGPIRKGRHNIAGTRYDVWFQAGGYVWWGVQYGDDHQIVHCKRLKEAAPKLS